MNTNHKIVVAMSGGVDSSVAAALLVEEGHDVIGITLNIWPNDPEADEARADKQCCALGAVEDARRVAGRLGIPHYVLNYRDVFRRTVVEDFCREYWKGRTPNPCIRCNQWIKFGMLLSQAEAMEATAVATGHYARIRQDERSGRFVLGRGRTQAKDQTYALYSLTQYQLAHAVFPLGEMTKEETRAKARALGLNVAEKGESQDICFVTGAAYPRFVQNHMGEIALPGEMVDVGGVSVGEHRGLVYYTVGQRKGLGISRSEPTYVVRLEAAANRVVVGAKDDLLATRFAAAECNWISYGQPPVGTELKAQARYKMAPAPAIITKVADDGKSVEAEFLTAQSALAPGQAVVFYEGDDVVGGGILS